MKSKDFYRQRINVKKNYSYNCETVDKRKTVQKKRQFVDRAKTNYFEKQTKEILLTRFLLNKVNIKINEKFNVKLMTLLQSLM